MIRHLFPVTSRAIWLWAWMALIAGFFISQHTGLLVLTQAPAPVQMASSHHANALEHAAPSDTHGNAAINSHASSHQQNCQAGSNQSCHDTAHQSNDCLWQCLLVCLSQMLLFVMCLAIGLKMRLLAYGKLALTFKSSLLKRLLKPPKNLTVFA